MAKHAVTVPSPRKPPGKASEPDDTGLYARVADRGRDRDGDSAPLPPPSPVDPNLQPPSRGEGDEADLTKKAHERLPREVESRYEALARKRDAESLTPSEYQELLRLTDRVERFEVQRLDALARLARLRGLSLKALIKALDLQSPPNG
jgi:hypothetical protein